LQKKLIAILFECEKFKTMIQPIREIKITRKS